MAEDFVSPIGIRSESEDQTWSIVVLGDGSLQLRSNSPIGEGDQRLAIDDNTGEVSIGTAGTPTNLTVTERINLQDTSETVRVRLSAPGQRIELLNSEGEIISMMGGGGNIRAGTNGENGDLFLYRATSDDIFQNNDATIRLNSASGNAVLGGNGVGGDVILRDGDNTTRARLSARNQRLEVMNADGEIIGMIGGAANIRAGSNGEDGDLFLFPASASDIFGNGDATASIRASSGDLSLGGNDVNGDVFVRDGENTVRARLSAGGQRVELSNRQGQIIGMLGGGGNIRAGTSGETGELYLFRAQASDIFSNGDASISLNAANGDANLGGNGVNGDLFLRDSNGNVRARLRSGSQRLELLDAGGEIIGMMGGAGNIRAGTNGEAGNLFLFPADATDIFDNGQASIRMDGNNGNITIDGDITLQNADCAEDFQVACPVEAEPGTVMVINDDLQLDVARAAYDSRVAGIVAGAGDYRPGIVLGRTETPNPTMPIALVGRACCKVDATHEPIAIGDLLTTSPTPGHAMKASDPEQAFGAVIGKALAPLAKGRGLIPVLVALQ
ncbi:autotransporter outer membrane beta-barrel domain-containing protein [Roseobacter sinensis]|uniref:Uncharacterized protein n=1 Tax=Roseobacter sinensis TaxID=2931391 RepID=A0ABT3BL04_9RHOB|nr:hypothetical protein [Roseobacter sp. WL0113]MCV3274235.1 hypothetical protein [Roseobacter sp. WL0113]